MVLSRAMIRFNRRSVASRLAVLVGLLGVAQVLSACPKMKKRQEKVKSLVKKGKSIEEIIGEFGEDEARLIKTIHEEIKKSSG